MAVNGFKAEFLNFISPFPEYDYNIMKRGYECDELVQAMNLDYSRSDDHKSGCATVERGQNANVTPMCVVKRSVFE